MHPPTRPPTAPPARPPHLDHQQRLGLLQTHGGAQPPVQLQHRRLTQQLLRARWAGGGRVQSGPAASAQTGRTAARPAAAGVHACHKQRPGSPCSSWPLPQPCPALLLPPAPSQPGRTVMSTPLARCSCASSGSDSTGSISDSGTWQGWRAGRAGPGISRPLFDSGHPPVEALNRVEVTLPWRKAGRAGTHLQHCQPHCVGACTGAA